MSAAVAAVAAATCRADVIAAAVAATDTGTGTDTNADTDADVHMNDPTEEVDDEEFEKPVVGELTGNSDREVFVAYLQDKHAVLVTLFPSNTCVTDLFSQVEQSKSIDEFFDVTSDPVAKQAIRRLENEIGQWLKEEAHLKKLKGRGEKCAERTELRKTKKRKWTQPEEPEVPPMMSLDEAAAANLLAADDRAKAQREKVLENGFVFRGIPPKEIAMVDEHIKYLCEAPRTVVESFGGKLLSNPANLEAFGVEVKFDRAALLKLEEIKRAGNPNAKGKDRLKHSYFSLPTSGPTVTWSDFFNVFIGWAYRQGGTAEFKTVLDGTKESLEADEEAAVAKVEGKYDAQLATLTKKISKADLEHSAAKAGPKKEGLKKQLDSLRAARDGLLTEQAVQVGLVEAKYERMLEVRAETDARVEALKAKGGRSGRDAAYTPGVGGWHQRRGWYGGA